MIKEIRDKYLREFKEETGLDIEVKEHIYTTDFFQISAFNQVDQIISIYYFVEAKNLATLKISETKFDFIEEVIKDKTATAESFRFIDFNKLSEIDVTLPIDKVVISLIKKTAL